MGSQARGAPRPYLLQQQHLPSSMRKAEVAAACRSLRLSVQGRMSRTQRRNSHHGCYAKQKGTTFAAKSLRRAHAAGCRQNLRAVSRLQFRSYDRLSNRGTRTDAIRLAWHSHIAPTSMAPTLHP
eukprot:2317593-Amphidinium_carterae.1